MTQLESLKPLPIEFILSKTHLSWREAIWGFEKGWLRWKSLIDLAKHRQTQGTDNVLLDTLARCGKDQSHEVEGLALELAQAEEALIETDVKAKWQYLIVARIHELRPRLDDFWRIITEIYDDFEYPQDMNRFISYTEECRESYERLVSQGDSNPRASLDASMLESLELYIQKGALRFGVKRRSD